MSITRVLQPYVCCIGNPVAGNPTQFVMVRAAQAAGVDWRFFTSQVAVDQFETAFRGIQALGLDGVAIFDPFQSQAISLLDSVTESALALNRVNVARSDSNSWLGDNTLGAALARCIDPRLFQEGWIESKLAIEDASTNMGSIVVLNEPTIATVVRLAASSIQNRVIDVADALVERDNATADLNESAHPSIAEIESLDGFVTKRQPVDFMIFNRIPSAAVLRQIPSIAWNANAGCLVLAPGSESQLKPLRDQLRELSVKYVEPIELMANQAAADFHFWTGVAPSVDLIRESFEEYLQW